MSFTCNRVFNIAVLIKNLKKIWKKKKKSSTPVQLYKLLFSCRKIFWPQIMSSYSRLPVSANFMSAPWSPLFLLSTVNSRDWSTVLFATHPLCVWSCRVNLELGKKNYCVIISWVQCCTIIHIHYYFWGSYNHMYLIYQ